ncbi:RAPID ALKALINIZATION FACTOR 1, RALF-LIKE 1, rapid alkalinization factor 1 [Hibiscus trionum]|uniref:RAPID ALKALINIZATION FACTOR 1, RALF-LIKE 1, rapid alkalinization factor 1 n=1 Tax=Hibiscus trionum TaxID=183268 RepID=A0A9W7HAN9_HIBTR|nr:RAPID ALKALINIZATION FACTOR 1, RALF-LIKE 1, rapid alkalinization factor 1 [Hibiscus trionum]
MANPSAFLLSFSLLLSTTALLTAVSASSGNGVHRSIWAAMTNESGSCRGATAECMANNVDDELEFNRRILQTSNIKYISYGALQRDVVPCSLRGGSYYNCQPGAEANPYDRGCSAITRCRS